MTNQNPGIDYGRHTTANRDLETGIRYGIIHLHSLGECAEESFEAEYDPSCPDCGTDLTEDFESPGTCPHCEAEISDGGQYPDDASRHVLKSDGYEGMLDSSCDAWVFKSPYYTRAAFCSPCAPGACYLASPCEAGEKAYCFGHDWFDEEAPYPVYSVETDELISRPQIQATYEALRALGIMVP